MVTALNHAVADGRRAGGLNLSSSILTDEGEGQSEAGKGALLPEATAFPAGDGAIAEETRWLGSDESLLIILRKTHPSVHRKGREEGTNLPVLSNLSTRSSADIRHPT